MIKITTMFCISAMTGVLAFSSVSAADIGITGKVGTLGLGVDLTYGINEKLNARFNLNGASFDADGEEDGVEYEGNLKGQTIGGLIDYHPAGNGFRVSAGIYHNGNELDLDSTGANNTNVQIGDRDYDLSNATLNTNVGFNSIAPYLGIGWGNAVDKKSKWSFSADLGVLFQGTPEAKLKSDGTVIDVATGTVADVAVFEANLAEEEDNLNTGDLESFEFFPVVSIGASYRFK